MIIISVLRSRVHPWPHWHKLERPSVTVTVTNGHPVRLLGRSMARVPGPQHSSTTPGPRIPRAAESELEFFGFQVEKCRTFQANGLFQIQAPSQASALATRRGGSGQVRVGPPRLRWIRIIGCHNAISRCTSVTQI